MSRRPLRALSALLLLPALAVAAVASTASTALASVTSISWPGVPTQSIDYAQDNGGLAVVNDNCPNSGGGTSTAITTLNSAYTVTDSVPKTTGSWSVEACNASYGTSATGNDGTLYFVETSGSTAQLVAVRNGVQLWTHTINCTSATVYSLHLGYDGNLYEEVNCSGVAQLASTASATGATRFSVNLPGTQVVATPSAVMPYENGVAVVNNGINAYFYDYQGNLQPGDTFSPSAPSGSNVSASAITADGRAFLETGKYSPTNPTNSETHLYYKDVGSSTIHEVTLPTGKYIVAGAIYVTPSDGVAIHYTDSGGTAIYLGYFDSSGSEAYEQFLSSYSYYVGMAVDNLGNVIVTRLGGGSEQEVYVDSFNTSDTMTRLFDSNAAFGTSATDVFTTSDWVPESIGNGVIFLTLCHQTNPTGGWPKTCPSSVTPQVVAITTASQYSYPRSAMIGTLSSAPNYVALGDSYSSGEGNSPFIQPTDNNGGDGCDRSLSDAYPELVAPAMGYALRAFVACSGATSDEIYTGLNGEPDQLNSLGSNTNLVTVTSGGDDAGFPDFAEECVVGTCGTSSSQYTATMDYIANYLPANLELLYGRIRDAAPNATIAVVGYPEVVNTADGTCPTYVASADEQTAVENVVNGLNDAIRSAVALSGSGIEFIDPTASGSPFEGHSLCSTSSYFFGLNIAEHRFSFHPNVDGQSAYALLIADNI